MPHPMKGVGNYYSSVLLIRNEGVKLTDGKKQNALKRSLLHAVEKTISR